jgi:hypothetical protein
MYKSSASHWSRVAGYMLSVIVYISRVTGHFYCFLVNDYGLRVIVVHQNQENRIFSQESKHD